MNSHLHTESCNSQVSLSPSLPFRMAFIPQFFFVSQSLIPRTQHIYFKKTQFQTLQRTRSANKPPVGGVVLKYLSAILITELQNLLGP